MEEFYKEIEKKIKAGGYLGELSGEELYEDICEQIDGKENGEYVLLSKKSDELMLEYHITIYDEEFNLGILRITTPQGDYVIDFDK